MTDRLSLTLPQLVQAAGAMAAGGAVGTLVRDLCLKGQPAASSSWASHIPWVLLAVNVLGVFGATWALRRPLKHRVPTDIGRLVVITGFFGGLTSYSSLYVALGDIWHLSVWGAIVTAAGAVLSGVVSAALAMWVTS